MFKEKSPQELFKQKQEVENVSEVRFFKDNKRTEESLEMDAEELKEKYPYRYEKYLEVLRRVKKIQSEKLKEQQEIRKSLSNLKAEEREALINEENRLEIQSEFTSPRKYIRLINNLEEYIKSYQGTNPEGYLREHQKDVFQDLEKFFNQGKKEGYIDMATGTGKTAVFVELTKALAGDRNGKAPLKTLVLVPGKDLLHQTLGKDKKRGFGRFAPILKATAYYSQEKNLTGDVVVSTYSSFNNLVKNKEIGPDSFDLVICDEAHRSLGRNTKKNLETLSPEVVKIGLTATSEFSEKKKVSDLFFTMIHKMDIKEAIEYNILANMRAYQYNTNIEIKDVELSSQGDYSEKTLQQLNREGRNQKAVEFAKDLVQNGRSGIISCLPGQNLAHPKKVAELLNQEKVIDFKTKKERSLIAQVVSGEMKDSEREEIFNKFENGEIDVLTFVDVLREGWDSEKAKFIINLRPTLSKVLATQRLGRITRKNSDLQEGVVVEFDDHLPQGQQKPYTVFDIFEKESIVQGGSLVDTKAQNEVKKKTKKGNPLSEDFLNNLGMKTELKRELSVNTKIEKRERGVIVVNGEVFITENILKIMFGFRKDFLKNFIKRHKLAKIDQNKKQYFNLKNFFVAYLADVNSNIDNKFQKEVLKPEKEVVRELGVEAKTLKLIAHENPEEDVRKQLGSKNVTCYKVRKLFVLLENKIKDILNSETHIFL